MLSKERTKKMDTPTQETPVATTPVEKPKRPLNKWMQFLRDFRIKNKDAFVGKSSKVVVAAAVTEYRNKK